MIWSELVLLHLTKSSRIIWLIHTLFHTNLYNIYLEVPHGSLNFDIVEWDNRDKLRKKTFDFLAMLLISLHLLCSSIQLSVQDRQFANNSDQTGAVLNLQ